MTWLFIIAVFALGVAVGFIVSISLWVVMWCNLADRQ